MFQKFVGEKYYAFPQYREKGYGYLMNIEQYIIYFFDCENETFKVVWDGYDICLQW